MLQSHGKLALRANRHPFVRAPRNSRVNVKAASATETVNSPLAGKKVFLAGATGGVGRQVLELCVDNKVPVRALARDPESVKRLPFYKPELVEVVKGDVGSYPSLTKAVGDANVLICASGTSDPGDPLGPFNVDFQGTLNLLALAKQRAFQKFVLVSSIGADELVNFLNLFWGVLFWKRQAEREIERSGVDYTIIRPGGLKSQLREGETPGRIVMKPQNTYGVPPFVPPGKQIAGSILRRQVAELCLAALYEPGASNKIVEVITQDDAPALPIGQLFNEVEN
ncbi:dehydrogenase [Dunaliella salina]|uniref:Dehydrogenase n=1 Tax=Dunaliella salina TaxID=3046 RepID=A0ABQ7GSE9_DUNSA|nr:dehydrogenase [Dunaliella salina]|eukprot:KAF5837508.1 dehydrogenase [Dunaliella salina]